VLAEALNNLAAKMGEPEVKAPEPQMPNIHVTMPSINLTAQMPEQGSVNIAIPEQPAPIVNVAPAEVTVNVEPTPVEVHNEVTVQPADLEIGTREAKVKRDAQGKIDTVTIKDK